MLVPLPDGSWSPPALYRMLKHFSVPEEVRRNLRYYFTRLQTAGFA